MKRFIKKVLLYFVVLCLIISSVDVAYIFADRRYTPDTTGSFRNDKAVIRDVPDGITLCDFGNSHVYYGIDYENVSDQVCFNFALSSQTISYDYRILKEFQDHLCPGAVVFIALSFFSVFGAPETDDENFSAKNKRYYKFLSAENIKEYDVRTDFYVSLFPVLLEDDFTDLLQTFFGWKRTDYWSRATTQEKQEKYSASKYLRHIEITKDQNGERIYAQEEIAALYDMISLCKSLDMVPILITTPYLREYTDGIRKTDGALLEEFYAVVNEVCEETGVAYYDYSTDERFCGDYSLFFNTDHMNQKGAKKFTDILLHEVL